MKVCVQFFMSQISGCTHVGQTIKDFFLVSFFVKFFNQFLVDRSGKLDVAAAAHARGAHLQFAGTGTGRCGAAALAV